jgi:uncharacterized protein YdeI (YjbR/CyaY-like superfamily)
MQENTIELFYPTNQMAWRNWLEQNHQSKQAVWVVFYRQSSEKPSITWSDAVDEALCFGWIDSKKIKIDHETSHQYFSKRKLKSTWSKVNKVKIQQLLEANKMAEAGLQIIEIAKENGSWTLLDEVEALIIPDDLARELEKYPSARINFENHSKTTKKMLLQWIVLAKTIITREKRINEIAECCEKGVKPKGF